MKHVAMGFYHSDGLVSAWLSGTAYAKEGGRFATIPEIIQARLISKPDSYVWNNYFTTLTAEYLGIGIDGRLKIIVAHRVGPLSTLEGIKKAYSYSYKSRDRNRQGGRISHKEFLKLEAGGYGEVAVVDYLMYAERFEYPFIEPTRLLSFSTDELAAARLGGNAIRDNYATIMAAMNRTMLMEIMIPGFDPKAYRQVSQNLTAIQNLRKNRQYINPNIIENRDESNLPYFAYSIIHPDGDLAFAHLLSIGACRRMQFNEDRHPSLSMDIAPHSWNDGTRLLMIPHGTKPDRIVDGPDPSVLVKKHWRELMVKTTTDYTSSMFKLLKRGDQWFTEYRANDEVFDTSEPQFAVQSIAPVGDVQQFSTPILGYHGFFKYEIDRVRSFAPPQANAYCFVGEPKVLWNRGNPEFQVCDIQFYRVTVDTTQQIMRTQELSHNFNLMLRLMEE